MKEYGEDLFKEYQKLQSQEKALNTKALKRAKFLLKQPQGKSHADYLKDMDINEFTTARLIGIIMVIEADFVSKTKQGELFE